MNKTKIRPLLDWFIVIAGPPIVSVGIPFMIFKGIPFLLNIPHTPKHVYHHVIHGFKHLWMGSGTLVLEAFPSTVQFVEHPQLVFIVAGALFFVFLPCLMIRMKQQKQLWPVGFGVSAWLWYAAWEASLVGKGYNIRIDLLLVAAPLFLSTLLSISVSIVDIVKLFTNRNRD